jgi:quinolinate synthase
MLKKAYVYVTMGALFMAGCARSVAVERVKMGDAQLSCSQLLSEIQEADKFRKAAEDNKGVTGTNTAAVLLFWPALFVTYSDANEAIRAADERKANLTKLYTERNCDQSSR